MKRAPVLMILLLLSFSAFALPLQNAAVSQQGQQVLTGDQIPNPIRTSGWQLYWNITNDDGLGLYNISYKGTLILDSVLMTGITVTYFTHNCYFYDEIGGRPPDPANLTRYENATLALDDISLYQPQTGGFNITENADVPGYSYGQQFVFYPNGEFLLLMRISGGGCYDIHTYRPNWRLDFNLGGSGQNTISEFSQSGWLPVRTESQTLDSGARDPTRSFANWEVSDGLDSYYFTPFDYPEPTTTAPQLLVEAYHPWEIENSHAPAVFSPYIYLNGERVYRTHTVTWYLPQHTQDVYREVYFTVPILSGLAFYPGSA